MIDTINPTVHQSIDTSLSYDRRHQQRSDDDDDDDGDAANITYFQYVILDCKCVIKSTVNKLTWNRVMIVFVICFIYPRGYRIHIPTTTTNYYYIALVMTMMMWMTVCRGRTTACHPTAIDIDYQCTTSTFM
jgi:hypothetical protein